MHGTDELFLLAALYTIGETDNACFTGAFDGVGHVTALLDYSMDRAVRCCLLRLLESLLAPEASRQDEKAGRIAAANGRAFVEAGGIQLAVDLVAGQTLTSSIILAVADCCINLCSHCFACYLCVCLIFRCANPQQTVPVVPCNVMLLSKLQVSCY